MCHQCYLHSYSYPQNQLYIWFIYFLIRKYTFLLIRVLNAFHVIIFVEVEIIPQSHCIVSVNRQNNKSCAVLGSAKNPCCTYVPHSAIIIPKNDYHTSVSSERILLNVYHLSNLKYGSTSLR